MSSVSRNDLCGPIEFTRRDRRQAATTTRAPARIGLIDVIEHVFDCRASLECMDFQGTLFETPAPGLRSLTGTERHPLSRGAWVDVRRDFVSGADEVLERLIADVPWRAERRQMYDRVVDVPGSCTPTARASGSRTRSS